MSCRAPTVSANFTEVPPVSKEERKVLKCVFLLPLYKAEHDQNTEYRNRKISHCTSYQMENNSLLVVLGRVFRWQVRQTANKRTVSVGGLSKIDVMLRQQFNCAFCSKNLISIRTKRQELKLKLHKTRAVNLINFN